MNVFIYTNLIENGRGGGIRTHGTFPFDGFQDRWFRPLTHPSIILLITLYEFFS